MSSERVDLSEKDKRLRQALRICDLLEIKAAIKEGASLERVKKAKRALGEASLAMMAVGSQGGVAMLQWLQEQGEPIDEVDARGVTPLGEALRSGGELRSEQARWLLEAGARARVKGPKGEPINWGMVALGSIGGALSPELWKKLEERAGRLRLDELETLCVMIAERALAGDSAAGEALRAGRGWMERSFGEQVALAGRWAALVAMKAKVNDGAYVSVRSKELINEWEKEVKASMEASELESSSEKRGAPKKSKAL